MATAGAAAALAAGPGALPAPTAAAAAAEAAPDLKELSLEAIRQRLATLDAEDRAALAAEDYEREARLRRQMATLEAEIARRAREGIPKPPPDFRVPHDWPRR